MLYKHPGKHKIHGDSFDYVVVDAEGVEAKLAEGWSRTTSEALESSPPTREELELKASELGIEFDGRTSDKKLLERITDELDKA